MRVVVAMSGGVDSSVAAALLQRQGYEVVAMTLQLFDCDERQNERSCCGHGGVSAARAVAGRLGMHHYVIDGRELFEQRVLKPAWQDYAAGRTPNPCVRCNDTLKLGLLLEHAKQIGADSVATGHHARLEHGGHPTLRRGADRGKDQSYVLFSLTTEQLRRVLLPVGDLTKIQVRELARQLDLPNAERAESQDACIAQRGDFAEALRQRFGAPLPRSGVVRDTEGAVVGQHDGVHRFTVGQRKGIGVAFGRRRYVKAIDAERAEVIVGDHDELCASGLRATGVRWLTEVQIGEPLEAEVQLRYRHGGAVARVRPEADGVAVVHFDQPQRAITPGQAAVFYQQDRVVGGGWIERAFDA